MHFCDCLPQCCSEYNVHSYLCISVWSITALPAAVNMIHICNDQLQFPQFSYFYINSKKSFCTSNTLIWGFDWIIQLTSLEVSPRSASSSSSSSVEREPKGDRWVTGGMENLNQGPKTCGGNN